MSLQVWLPLTKDLRNQGLNSIKTVNVQSGCIIDNNGKLGKCYTNSGTTVNVANSISFSASKFSACAWVKLNTRRNNWTRAFGMSGNGTYFGLGCEHTNGTGLGFHYYKTIDGTNTSVFDTYPVNISTGVWNHFVMCYDGIKYYVYQNGSLVTSGNANKANIDCNMTALYLFGGTANSYSQCSLNDVRIYDHCLSPMEVKEIAKGLVLHYPLNRNGWGQDNLIITNSMAPLSGTSGWSSAGTGWANSNVVSSGASNGHAIRCTYSGTTQTSGGIHHPTGNTKGDLTDGAVYTLSARIRASKACRATFHNELQTIGNTINLTTEWRVYSFSSPIDNSKTYHSNTIYVQAADVEQNMWIECDWIKLEEGDKVTPWCPNSSDTLATTMGLNSTTEYDCSGFCNNGTRTGTFTWTSDTPKYAASTKLTTGSKITSSTGMITTANPTFTCNFWVKMPSVTYTAWADIITFPGSAQIRMETSNTTGTSLSWFNYPIGTSSGISTNGTVNNTDWNMFTLVCDSTNWKTYKNGILASTVAISGTAWTPNGSVSIGDNGMYAQISDVRIYATALSADDVKSLYQNSAYIDSSGNVYGTVHTEV